MTIDDIELEDYELENLEYWLKAYKLLALKNAREARLACAETQSQDNIKQLTKKRDSMKFKDMKKWDVNELRVYVEEVENDDSHSHRVVCIKKGKIVDSLLCCTEDMADRMAQEYLREEGIRKAWAVVK